MCEQLNVSPPDFTTALPDKLWGETGSNLQFFKAQADHLCSSLYIRIVDKGVGMLWGFCRHWAWQRTHEFMVEEGYRAYSRPPHKVIDTLKKEIHKQGWEINTKGKLGSLYLIGKAKSRKNRNGCGEASVPSRYRFSPSDRCGWGHGL